MDLDKLFIEHRKLLERMSALEEGGASNDRPERSRDEPTPPEVTKAALDMQGAQLAERIAAVEKALADFQANNAKEMQGLTDLIAAAQQPHAEPAEEDEPESDPPPHRRPRPRGR